MLYDVILLCVWGQLLIRSHGVGMLFEAALSVSEMLFKTALSVSEIILTTTKILHNSTPLAGSIDKLYLNRKLAV